MVYFENPPILDIDDEAVTEGDNPDSQEELVSTSNYSINVDRVFCEQSMGANMNKEQDGMEFRKSFKGHSDFMSRKDLLFGLEQNDHKPYVLYFERPPICDTHEPQTCPLTSGVHFEGRL